MRSESLDRIFSESSVARRCALVCDEIVRAARRIHDRELRILPARRIEHMARIGQRRGKRRRIANRKISMSIIDKHSDRRFQPCGTDDEVNDVVAVYIARGNFESADGAVHADHLPRTCAHAETDPIMGMGSADQPGFDRGEIGPAVAVKIGDREMRSRRPVREHGVSSACLILCREWQSKTPRKAEATRPTCRARRAAPVEFFNLSG